MTKKTLYKIMFGIIITSNSYAAFFEQSAEGWHWYQDPIVEQHELPKKLDLKPKTATDLIKDYQKELERKLHLALINPSYQNVKAYQLMQKDLTDRSQKFSETWMQVLYQTPELDHTLVSPVNQQGRHIYLDQEKRSISKKIYSLKEDYGLFFFFSSNCPYCYQFAPIVQQFAKYYDWKVLAISMDGNSIPEIKDFITDNGIADKLRVTVLPSLFAVNPTTRHVLPVAFGLTSIDQIETRIMVLTAQGDL